MKQKFSKLIHRMFSHPKKILIFGAIGLCLAAASVFTVGHLSPDSVARSVSLIFSSESSGASADVKKSSEGTISLHLKKIWTPDAVYSLMGETPFFPAEDGKYIDIVVEANNRSDKDADVTKLITAKIIKDGEKSSRTPDFFAVENLDGKVAEKNAAIPAHRKTRVHIIFPVSGEDETYTVRISSDNYKYQAVYKTGTIRGEFLPLNVGDRISAHKAHLKTADSEKTKTINATITLTKAYTLSDLSSLSLPDGNAEKLKFDSSEQEAFVMEFTVKNRSDFALPYSAAANMLDVADTENSQDICLNTVVVSENGKASKGASSGNADSGAEKTLAPDETGKIYCIAIRPRKAKLNRIYVGIDTDEYLFPCCSSISVIGDDVTLFIGEQYKIVTKTSPTNAKVNQVSEDPVIASVSSSLITAVSEGKTRVRVSFKYNGHEYVAYVNVTVLTPYVEIAEEKVDLYIDDTIDLNITTLPANQPFTLESSNPSVASVDASGKVKALSPGETVIKATMVYAGFTYTDTCTIKVTSPSVTLDKHSIEKYLGETETLHAVTVPENMTVTFESKDTDKASVDQNGVVTATGDGSTEITATITYKDHSYSDTCSVKVKTPTITSETAKTIYIGETFNVDAKTDPTGQTISYTSDKTAVATVNGSGLVTGKTAGTANITSKLVYAGYTYTAVCKVTVVSPTITTVTSKTIYVGDTFNVNAETDPKNQTVTYSSADTSLATVGNTGTVTGKKEGKVKITSKFVYEGYTYSAVCNVTVVTPSITCESSKTIYIGDTFNVNAKTDPKNQSITYSSADTSIATIGSTGIVTGKKTGTVKVTSKFVYAGITYSASCSVTVKSPSISTESSKTIYVGDTFSLSANTVPTNQTIAFSSADTGIATVSNIGVVTGKKEGKVKITAKFEYAGTTYSATCNVTVITPSITCESAKTIYIGETFNVNAKTDPQKQTISYSSGNPAIASVSNNGTVTGNAEGTVRITSKFVYAGTTYSAYCNVTVLTPYIVISGGSTGGSSTTLTATTYPSGYDVTWSSSKTDIATVNSSGVVTAVGKGTTTIKASFVCNDHTYSTTKTITTDYGSWSDYSIYANTEINNVVPTPVNTATAEYRVAKLFYYYRHRCQNCGHVNPYYHYGDSVNVCQNCGYENPENCEDGYFEIDYRNSSPSVYRYVMSDGTVDTNKCITYFDGEAFFFHKADMDAGNEDESLSSSDQKCVRKRYYVRTRGYIISSIG